MRKRLLLHAARAAGAPELARWTIGCRVSSDCSRVTAALVAAVGRGINMRAKITAVSACEIAPETAAVFEQLTCPGAVPADGESAARIASLAAQLANVEADSVGKLLAKSGLTQTEVPAVGVHDPGLWSSGQAMPGAYLGLCDAARLAELTGMNVIDAFPARDLARGGQGGPITALPEWILLRDPRSTRVLLDLGPSVRMTYLPRDQGADAASRILCFEVGPGMQMLDQLARRLTGGAHRFDPGGRFAVQGRRIGELEQRWLSDPYFRRPLPRWQPRGIRPERFLLDGIRMAVDSGWSVRDLLCTATHFVAAAIQRAVRQCLPRGVRVDEILLTGGGQHNGMLLREVAARLPGVPVVPIERLGYSGEAFGPACFGLLALLHVDGVPANHPAVTGTEISRVLGRLTPGSPAAWQRLLEELAANTAARRPLRAAS